MQRTENVMRRDWDDRARKNALYYIESSRTHWDTRAFFESGERDYGAFAEPALANFAFDPRGKTMVELGCGAGRMTRSFARRFARVCAVDISAEMLARGKDLLKDVANVDWVHGNGTSLEGVKSDSADFVFSYIVLQHLPTDKLTESYMTEILRVLNSGGLFLVQFNSLPVAHMNLKGRIAWGFLDALWSAGLVTLSRKVGSALGLDPLAVGKAWRGASIDSAKMRIFVERAGGRIRNISGDGTAMAWCCGSKP